MGITIFYGKYDDKERIVQDVGVCSLTNERVESGDLIKNIPGTRNFIRTKTAKIRADLWYYICTHAPDKLEGFQPPSAAELAAIEMGEAVKVVEDSPYAVGIPDELPPIPIPEPAASKEDTASLPVAAVSAKKRAEGQGN